MNKQTIKPKLIVVLGNEHGADLKYLKDNNIDYIYYDSDNMGKLRNIGLSRVKTNWWLYFSVDDELLPHACEEIINSDCDAVSLSFDVIEPNGTIKPNRKSPFITTIDQLNNWSKYWGGYVAIKNNIDLKYREDIKVPNLTLHFELFKRKCKIKESETICAIHHRWSGSHHYRSVKNRDTAVFTEEIERTKNEILYEYLEGENIMIKIKMKNKLSSLKGFEKCYDENNKELKSGLIEKGAILYVDSETYKYISGANRFNRNFCELLETVEVKESTKALQKSLSEFSEAPKLINVDDMKYNELKAHAKSLGLKFDNRIKKVDLLNLIKGA